MVVVLAAAMELEHTVVGFAPLASSRPQSLEHHRSRQKGHLDHPLRTPGSCPCQ